jgi:hypothetical protein
MRALQLYAGPQARAHVRAHGLSAADVGVMPAAAGGPKGLLLGRLDRFIFGEWLPQSTQPVHLVGASIGAWRMATACLDAPVAGLERLERDYIAQHYEIPPGRTRVSPDQVSAAFGQSLQSFYGGRVHEVLHHPRYRLHVLASRGRHWLGRETPWRSTTGYAAAFLTNLVRRRAMGFWLERVVFSSPTATGSDRLPFATDDYSTRALALTEANFMPALQASCSIPFVLRAVPHIPGAPAGAYWDGGITDYHLHLHYRPVHGLVLYPHFQRQVVPGWLDKSLRHRHRATPFLDHTLVLAPRPDWVQTLPNGKLPDRTDFTRYGNDLAGRMRVWNAAVSASQQLADEFAEWLRRPDPDQILPL